MRRDFGARVVIGVLWLLVMGALVCLAYYSMYGEATPALAHLRFAGLDLAFTLRIDALSSLTFLMTSLLAAIVGQYALRYLDGEARQWYFFRWLLVAVIAVSALVLSGNLVMFFLAWWTMSWGLHHLLLYSEQRPAAVYAARKKLLISRFGDIVVMGGLFLVYQACHSFDFRQIFALAENRQLLDPSQASTLAWAGGFLAFGAVAKSAQFPLHFWLPETMETPTPVSALMHAGIINAGGFLVIRLSPIMSHAPIASVMLTLVGSISAVYAALVMMTQNSIKRKLAYSTISQMGMMLFACGIGAYALALFHILAHSFYKAHAFLSTGDMIEESRHASLPLPPLSRVARVAALVLVSAPLIYALVSDQATWIAPAAYGFVLLLGFSQGISSWPYLPWLARGSVLFMLLLSLLTYVLFEYGLSHWVASELVVSRGAVPWLPASAVIACSIFALGFWVAAELMEPRSSFMKKLYIFLWNDGHLGVTSTRFLSRIWPV